MRSGGDTPGGGEIVNRVSGSALRIYPERYEDKYGDLRQGFARVRCRDCGHEYLLACSCKRRCFCTSCHTKRAVAFAEWLHTTILLPVPHRQIVLTIPKMLRIGADDATGRENLARYLIRAPFSAQRITYNAAEGTVIYRTRNSTGTNGNEARIMKRTRSRRLLPIFPIAGSLPHILAADPLECPDCHGSMRIISFIEKPRVIRAILMHLALWDVPRA